MKIVEAEAENKKQSKSKKMVAKRMAEVWRCHGNAMAMLRAKVLVMRAVTVGAMVMAMAMVRLVTQR
jgi:hypothetical protein